jgi:hypothetical protein
MKEIPLEFQGMENITVLPKDTKSKKTISFQKKTVYGESTDLLIGQLGDIAVDMYGNVFVTDTKKQVIHTFSPNGDIIHKFGGAGNGPGEFSSIKSIEIKDHLIFVHDFHQNRLTAFNLCTLDVEFTLWIGKNKHRYKELRGSYPLVSEVYAFNRERFLVKYLSNQNYKPSEIWDLVKIEGHIYMADQNGELLSKVVNFSNSTRTMIPYNGVPIFELPLTPFYGIPFTVISSEGYIYHMQPNKLLIKVFKHDGTYQHAFTHPIQKVLLTKESAVEVGIPELETNNPDRITDAIDLIELPEYWPVITDMKIDDENRLWIATTVENFDVYEWWVLENTGELITKFEWPRDEPIEVIKNGYMYTRDTDEQTGLQQVVRYRIEFDEVNQTCVTGSEA